MELHLGDESAPFHRGDQGWLLENLRREETAEHCLRLVLPGVVLCERWIP